MQWSAIYFFPFLSLIFALQKLLYLLLSFVSQLLWYHASLETLSPSESLAIIRESHISVAHFLMLAPSVMVDAWCISPDSVSQKKHFTVMEPTLP